MLVTVVQQKHNLLPVLSILLRLGLTKKLLLMTIFTTSKFKLQYQKAGDGYWHFDINDLRHIVRIGLITSHTEKGKVYAFCLGKNRLLLGISSKEYAFKKHNV